MKFIPLKQGWSLMELVVFAIASTSDLISSVRIYDNWPCQRGIHQINQTSDDHAHKCSTGSLIEGCSAME